MIVLAMPRIENEMPYGSGVVHGEEYVTTSFVTVQHRDYTVYQFVGKHHVFARTGDGFILCNGKTWGHDTADNCLCENRPPSGMQM